MAFLPAFAASPLGAIIGGAGASVAASKLLSGGPKPSAQPVEIPQAPKPEASSSRAAEFMRKKKAAVSQSVYTSALGVSDSAQVARKTLLGQ